MKKLYISSITFLLIVSCVTSCKNNPSSIQNYKVKVVDPTKYASSITGDELKEMLYKYASDEFEGRKTGEKGQKLAVEYLKTQYKSLGIPSPLGGDDYFQEVPLEKQGFTEAITSINGKNFDTLIVLAISKNIDILIDKIIYVGYGIDDKNYSDYNNLDIKGKIVLAKAGEPKDAYGNYVTSGSAEDTNWNSGYEALTKKKNVAKNKGAMTFFYLDDPLFNRYLPFYKQQLASGSSNRITSRNEEDITMLLINETIGKAIYKAILEENEAKTIDTNINLSIKNTSEVVNSENVLAFIKGSEKPNEIIVISAHLDHEGVKNGEIYNGADDDGSGTVAILEIAEAFKMAEKAGNAPKRSILFLHVTGEEEGLLGSMYYTDKDPVFPLKNTVANLNIDMIGRTDPKRKEGNRNYIYLIGSDKLSTDLHNISEEINSKYTNIELDYKYNNENDPNRFYYRSDHYNFAKNNIPVIFYFNGTHNDYHRPSDTPDKISYDLLENRTKLVFYTAWELANRADRIVVDKAFK